MKIFFIILFDQVFCIVTRSSSDSNNNTDMFGNLFAQKFRTRILFLDIVPQVYKNYT